MRFAFIDAEKAHYPVTVLCRVMDGAIGANVCWKLLVQQKLLVLFLHRAGFDDLVQFFVELGNLRVLTNDVASSCSARDAPIACQQVAAQPPSLSPGMRDDGCTTAYRSDGPRRWEGPP